MSEEVILLQNCNIALEVGSYSDIYDFTYDKHIAKEYFELWELNNQDETVKVHKLDDADIVFTNKNEDATVSKQLAFDENFIWKQEYRLRKDEPLKWRSFFQDFTGIERRICMVKVWEMDRSKIDRFTAYETSFKGVQLITPDWQSPYEFNGWKVSFGNAECEELITEDFTNEFETWFLPKTVIEVTEDKVICKFIYYYVVQPWWVIDLDPTTYTYSQLTNFDGTVYQTTDAYSNLVWVSDYSSLTTYWGNAFTQYSRGFFKFDVTGIPDESTITLDALLYQGYANAGTVNSLIKSLAYDPSTRTIAQIHGDIGSGTQLVDSATFPVVGSSQSEDLGATGVSELQGKLSGNWFALGCMNKTESAEYIKRVTSLTATPFPTLYVEFTLPQNIAKIMEVSWANVSKLMGISKGVIRKVMGVWSG